MVEKVGLDIIESVDILDEVVVKVYVYFKDGDVVFFFLVCVSWD